MMKSVMPMYVCIPFIAKFTEIKNIMKHYEHAIVTIHIYTWLFSVICQYFSIYSCISPLEMGNWKKKKLISYGICLWSSQFLASCSTWPETYVSAGINWAGAAGKFFVVGVLFIYSCHFLQVLSLWFIFWREIKFRHIGHIDLSFSNLCQKNPKESWLRILVFNSYLKHKIVIHYILHTHRFFRLTG